MAVRKHSTKAGSSQAVAAARRELFRNAYMANGHNATQAAITAGFSAKTAYSQGQRLLKRVELSGELAAAAEKVSVSSGLSVERTLTEVKRISYVDPRRFYREDGSQKPPGEWDDDMAAAVSSVEAIPVALPEGKIGYTYKIKFWNKNAGLESSMKHLGLYEKDNAQSREGLALLVKEATRVKR